MEGKDLTAIADSDFLARQQTIDVEKWLASERAGRDLCGTQEYCPFCVKAEMHPCAKAEFRFKMRAALDEIDAETALAEDGPAEGTAAAEDEPTEETEEELKEECAEEIAAEMLAGGSEGRPASPEPAAQEIMSEDAAPSSGAEQTEIAGKTERVRVLPEGYEEVIRYRRTFKSRLIQNDKAQDYYTELKNALSELSGIRSRMCQGCENFRAGGKKIAKINIGGKTLVLYLALDPAAYEETKYRFTDVSEKKTYADTPMKLRITSNRALKHAKELIEDLAESFELANVGCIFMDYHYPYRTDEQLIEKGLIKPYKAIVKKKN